MVPRIKQGRFIFFNSAFKYMFRVLHINAVHRNAEAIQVGISQPNVQLCDHL